MTKEQFIMNLFILLQSDIRMYVCTYKESKLDYWEHIQEKCPKCVAMKIVGLSTD